ncbi:MAG TPA: hypothetical protein VJQ60_12610 [Arthrobacter sp.]|nr:hypothetical protein [Arthrobacter sp.]
MHVALFWGTVAPEWRAREEYPSIGLMMFQRAQTMEGFAGLHKFDMGDGQELAIAYFETEEAMRNWYRDPEHRVVEQLGRETILSDYKIEILEMTRSYTKVSSTFVPTDADHEAGLRLLRSVTPNLAASPSEAEPEGALSGGPIPGALSYRQEVSDLTETRAGGQMPASPNPIAPKTPTSA